MISCQTHVSEHWVNGKCVPLPDLASYVSKSLPIAKSKFPEEFELQDKQFIVRIHLSESYLGAKPLNHQLRHKSV